MKLTETQLRKIIRKSLLAEMNDRFDIAEEDLPTQWKKEMKEKGWTWERGVGFMGKPNSKGKRRKIINAASYGASTIGYPSAAHAIPYMYDKMSEFPSMKRIDGIGLKSMFAKAYKKHKSFFDSFTYVHWTDDLEKTLQTNNKNELSCVFYDEPPFIISKAGVGVELKGWVTAMANVNMFTGYESAPLDFGDKDFIDDMAYERSPQRHNSSGHNKYPVTRRALELDAKDFESKAGYILSPDDVDYDSIDRVRRGGNVWGDSTRTQLNNEALIDNWKPVRIILTRHLSGEDRKEVVRIAKKHKLEVVDEDGKPVIDGKRNNKSIKSLQDELDRIGIWDKKSKAREKPKPPPTTSQQPKMTRDESEAEYRESMIAAMDADANRSHMSAEEWEDFDFS